METASVLVLSVRHVGLLTLFNAQQKTPMMRRLHGNLKQDDIKARIM